MILNVCADQEGFGAFHLFLEKGGEIVKRTVDNGIGLPAGTVVVVSPSTAEALGLEEVK